MTAAPLRFAGKVAFVTGGASGLGRAAAERLSAEGATVIVADIDAAAPTPAHPSRMPSGSRSTQPIRRPSIALSRGPRAPIERVDVIVNNAGVVGPQLPLHETDEESWRRVMSVNADGAFHVLRRGIACLLAGGGGAVVNMVSSTALSGKPNLTPYTFAKAGLAGITRSAAIEYAARRIRVNAVAPTAVMTPLIATFIAAADDPEQMRAFLESQTPIPGLPQPEDVAAAVAFLASEDAKWITGHVLPVDGGFHAR